MEFGGSQYLAQASNSSEEFSAYTISAYVYFSSQPTGNDSILGTRANGDCFDVKYDYVSSGVYQIHADIGYGGGWINTSVNENITLTPATWNMITFTVNSSGCTIYVNGTPYLLAGTQSYSWGTAPLFAQASDLMEIGQTGADSDAVSGQEITDVVLYNSVLSATQVSKLYSAGVSGAGSDVSPNSIFNVTGGTLDLDGNSPTLLGLTGSGTVINSNSSTATTLTIATAGTDTFTGSIQNGAGTVALNLTGAGTVSLTGNNAYTGATNVSAGSDTLNLNNNAAAINVTGGSLTLSGSTDSGPITDSNGTLVDGVTTDTGAVTVSGGTMTLSSSATASGSITVSSGTLTINGTDSGNATVSGGTMTVAASASYTGSLTVSGGMLILDDSYSGAITVTSGTLQMGSTGLLSATTTVTLTGGTFDLDGTSQTLATLTGLGTVTDSATGTTSTLTLEPSSPSTFGGAIQNGAGTVALTMSGSSTQTLTGTSTYSGATTIDSGVLQPLDPAAGASYTTGQFGQAVQFTGSDFIQVPGSASLELTSYTVSAWVYYTAQPPLNANGPTDGIIGTRNGTYADNFDLKYYQVSAGVYQLHADVGYLDGWNTTAANYNTTLPLDTWNLITYSANSSGCTIYLNGTQVATFTTALGTYAGATPYFAYSNSTLDIGATDAASGSYEDIAPAGSAIDDVTLYNSVLTATQVQSLYTNPTAPGVSGLVADYALDGTVGSSVSTATGAIIDSASGLNGTLASYIAGTGSLSATSIVVMNGGTLNLNGTSQTIGGLSGTAGTILNNTAGTSVTLTVAPTGSDTFSGTIQNGAGTVSVNVNGTGTQILAGTNTYSGGTTLSAGTLGLNSLSTLGIRELQFH